MMNESIKLECVSVKLECSVRNNCAADPVIRAPLGGLYTWGWGEASCCS